MKYVASLEYKDDSDTTHALSKGTDTQTEGVLLIYEWLRCLIVDWPRIDPRGVQVSALVKDLDGDHCGVYTFNLGV